MSALQLWFYFVVIPKFGIAFTLIAIVSFAIWGSAIAAKNAESLNLIKVFISLFIILTIGVIGMLCPSKQEMALIVAGDYISNNKTLTDTGSKALQVLNKYLDEALNDDT